MELKFLVIFTLIIACKAFNKDTKREKEEFIRLATLGNFWTYLANDMYQAIECYDKIKSEYGRAIDEFQNDVNKYVHRMNNHYVDEKYNYYSRACFEELSKIAHRLFMFKSHLEFELNKKDVRKAIELAKGIKVTIEPPLDGYLTHKDFFYSQPLKNTTYFYDHDKQSRGKFIQSIKRFAEKFIRCGERHRQLTKY